MNFKNIVPLIIFLFSSAVLLSSCDAVIGIFEAGFWTAIIAIIIIIFITGFVMKKLKDR